VVAYRSLKAWVQSQALHIKSYIDSLGILPATCPLTPLEPCMDVFMMDEFALGFPFTPIIKLGRGSIFSTLIVFG